MLERTAACACGQLRITCKGEPVRVSICSCTACQRRTGSAYSVNVYFQQSSVEAVVGTFKTFTRTSDAGRWLNMHFCPVCGTTVFWEAEFAAAMVGTAVGAFADPSFPAPTAAVWTQDKMPWVAVPEDIPCFPKARPL
jgi:hypothetical protein